METWTRSSSIRATCAFLWRAGIIAASDWNRAVRKARLEVSLAASSAAPGSSTPRRPGRSPLSVRASDSHARPAKMKPIADQILKNLPFGSLKREGQHDRTRRNTGGDARSQVDPPHGGTDARVHRQACWRDQSPLRLRGYMVGPASLASIPPPTALREARLNGFPGALAGVLRHRIGGRRRRVSDTSATGLSDAAKAGEPAYSLGPHSVRPLRRLAGGRAPSDPRDGNGAS